jgi:hypothetical protein
VKARTVTVQLSRDGAMCSIPVPFDPKAAFGKVRAPVVVTLKGHSYRSTIFSMHGATWIPLRKSHREAAGLEGNERLRVKFVLDTVVRKVAVPPDLARELKANRAAAQRWDSLSYTHRREHVEAIVGAKKPETRVRRVANTLRALKVINSRAHGDRR